MPTMRYALEKDGPKRLDISWRGGWKNLTICLDGAPVGAIRSLKLRAEA